MNIRSYKKQYAICKDDFGKMIYAGDTKVTIQLKFQYQYNRTGVIELPFFIMRTYLY